MFNVIYDTSSEYVRPLSVPLLLDVRSGVDWHQAPSIVRVGVKERKEP